MASPSPPLFHYIQCVRDDAVVVIRCLHCVVAAMLSDWSVVLYNTTSGKIAHRIKEVHTGLISEVHFLLQEYRRLGDTVAGILLLGIAIKVVTIKL